MADRSPHPQTTSGRRGGPAVGSSPGVLFWWIAYNSRPYNEHFTTSPTSQRAIKGISTR